MGDVMALDIGGANLKAADGLGFAVTRPLALWQDPDALAAQLSALLAAAPRARNLAVTMTGELADCFATKAEGVRAILQSVSHAASGRPILVYLTDGTFVSPEVACASPLQAAAANWHALARLAARYVPRGAGLLVDIGSTTCDIIPLVDGTPAAAGCTDPERLIAGELVYTGVQRSPVCAMVDRVPWRGRWCPVARELFATTWDAYLLLDALPEAPERTDTADGRPATKPAARDRLARMICADRDMVSYDETIQIAGALADAQQKQIQDAAVGVLRRLPQPPRHVVLSGLGEFVARRVVDQVASQAEVTALSQELGAQLSQAATAHALAVLFREVLTF